MNGPPFFIGYIHNLQCLEFSETLWNTLPALTAWLSTKLPSVGLASGVVSSQELCP